MATTLPSFTTSAANGPPFVRTLAAASSMACSINRFMIADASIVQAMILEPLQNGIPNVLHLDDAVAICQAEGELLDALALCCRDPLKAPHKVVWHFDDQVRHLRTPLSKCAAHRKKMPSRLAGE